MAMLFNQSHRGPLREVVILKLSRADAEIVISQCRSEGGSATHDERDETITRLFRGTGLVTPKVNPDRAEVKL